MIIYKQEKLDGLEEILLDPSNASIKYTTELIIPRDKSLAIAKDIFLSSAKSKQNQFDLFYLNTILASVGWNINDDVFLKKETWVAKDSPEDKPFNYQHDPTKIIGHITGSVAVDTDYNIIDAKISMDDIPDTFHILTSAVIYKHIKSLNEQLEKEISELIAEIEDNKWYVSMECLYNDFDYAVIHANKQHEIIPRNEKTSFLTKHLRSYGGKGVFQDRKIGRAIKNITFSGKGLVKKPANTNSVILTTEQFEGVIANENIIHVTTKENIPMSDTKEQGVVELQREIATLKQQFETEKVQKKYDEYEAKITSLTQASDVTNKDKDVLSKKVVELESANVILSKDKEDLNTKLVKANEDIKTKTDELVSIQSSVKKSERITTLVDKGVDKTRAEELTDKFQNLSDEQFMEIVNIQAALVESAKNSKVEKTEAKTEELEVEKDVKDGEADPAVLEAAEKDGEEVAMSTASEEQGHTMMKELSTFLASQVKPTKKK